MLFLLPRNSTEYKPKGRFFWYAYDALIHWCLHRNMPKACPML